MRCLIVIGGVVGLVAAAFLVSHVRRSQPESMSAGRFPEQLVYVRTDDDIVEGGVIFTPPADVVKPVAVIWIHGWGVNFYSPTYVAIGRALAGQGYTCIIGNTRMHDIGNVLAWRGQKRIRGGGYWGLASDQGLDVAAWISCAEKRGFKKVVLVGHSAGWAAVRGYQAEKQDERVVGMVLASGAVRGNLDPPDPDQVAEAKRLMAAGESEALVRDPKRSFPSYVSAATLLDIANSSQQSKDFFGIQTPNADVTRIVCPLLAFFGSKGDVGTEADLELLKSSIKRQPRGPRRVETVMIRGADHMYSGEERQVAETVAKWADTLLEPGPLKGDNSTER